MRCGLNRLIPITLVYFLVLKPKAKRFGKANPIMAAVFLVLFNFLLGRQPNIFSESIKIQVTEENYRYSLFLGLQGGLQKSVDTNRATSLPKIAINSSQDRRPLRNKV